MFMDLDLESLFGNEDIEIDCPQCQSKFSVKFREIMTDGNIVQCPHCQVDIQLNHDETTKKTLSDVDHAFGEFNKSFKKFERTLKKFGK